MKRKLNFLCALLCALTIISCNKDSKEDLDLATPVSKDYNSGVAISLAAHPEIPTPENAGAPTPAKIRISKVDNKTVKFELIDFKLFGKMPVGVKIDKVDLFKVTDNQTQFKYEGNISFTLGEDTNVVNATINGSIIGDVITANIMVNVPNPENPSTIALKVLVIIALMPAN